MKKWILGGIAVLAVSIAGGVWLYAAPSVGTLTASPAYVVINTPTQVLMAISITEPTLLANGVNLLKVDASGKTLSTVGVMKDDGLNGDAVAGDKVFSYRLSVNQPSVGQVFHRASAAFKGVLQRKLSNIVSITLDPFALPPDPGEAGKQTLAGIDTDGDGVRDDVQRYIALNYGKQEPVVSALRQLAKAQQHFLGTFNDRATARQSDLAREQAEDCLIASVGLSVASTAAEDLRARIVNTKLRTQAYFAADANLGGRVVLFDTPSSTACIP